jgi:UDP-N-acetylglucosamine 1-carboxyvinyltransferase
MDQIIIEGGRPLKGEIIISGAKNAALPLMAASILTKDTIVLSNMPQLADVVTMSHLLIHHGVRFSVDGVNLDKNSYGRTILLNAENINNFEAPYEIVRKMRASVLVLGPLLARFGEAKVSLPGGCAIGTRPINLHLEALKALGAKIEISNGYVVAKTDGKLIGAKIYFDSPSVGATENILMAATLATGKTTIHNAAKEPEVVDLAKLLVAMGAKIKGAGSSVIEIEGVEKLNGAYHEVIADRIEAGTYAIATLITKGNVILKNVRPEIFSNITEKLKQVGANIKKTKNTVHISANGELNPIDISTGVYPGFPTDMQAQFMTLMAVTNGTSVVHETIFENRFMHVPELIRMGADISISSNTATVRGVKRLKAAEVMATDLRASVSLVLAGLVAEGKTTINRIYHIDRGYEKIEDKLGECGVKIYRVSNYS